MLPSCPLCQQSFTPGALFCPGCGASLLLEAVPGGAHPVCAVHPALRGLGTCGRCGAFACARCLRAGPKGETLCARCQALEPDQTVPWDERAELGTWRALWRTFVQVLLRPHTLAQIRAEGRAGESLLFIYLCWLLTCLSTGLVYAVIFTAIPRLISMFSPPGQTSREPSEMAVLPWVGLGLFMGLVLLGPLAALALSVVGAALDHLVLRASGVTREFRVTLRAYALSQAPWALGVVPLLGAQVAQFWTLVSRVYAYRGLHRTSWGVALAGALVVPVSTCCLCGGGYLALLSFAFSRGH